MDEWIVAGDANFMAKAERRISSFVAEASVLVLASHSEEICRRWCNKAILMEQGKIQFRGSVKDTLEVYRERSRDGVTLAQGEA